MMHLSQGCFESPSSYKLGQQTNQLHVCTREHMPRLSPALLENACTLHGYMYADVRRRGKVQGPSMLSQGSVARATA